MDLRRLCTHSGMGLGMGHSQHQKMVCCHGWRKDADSLEHTTRTPSITSGSIGQ